MDLAGEIRIMATRDTVWIALNDPAVLARCIPGCETVELRENNVFTARIAAKVGPVSARFSGTVTLEEIDAPNSYTLRGEGNGGVAGFGKGEARVTLAPDGTDTVLTYAAKAKVGGKLAQLGARIVDGFARKMADDFFTRFAAELNP